MKGYNGLRMMALMFVVVATMVLGACREEEDKDVFTVYIDGYNGGKDYMGGLDIFWNEGDRVRINNNIYSVNINESDHNKATINAEGVTTYGGAYYAAYPADMSSIGLDGTITFDMPAEEIYATDAGGRQKVQNIMAATTDDHQLTFAPLGALLHFSVASSASGARLCSVEVESDKAACGTMTATHSDEGWNFTPPSPALPTNMKRTLRFSTPEAVGAAAKDFYLVVAPMTDVTSFTLRFVFENAAGDVKVFERTKSGTTFNIAKGSIYRFVTSFDGTNINVAGESVSAATMDGTASHPYLVCSQRSWERTMSSNATNAAKYISLANDIQVATTVAEFKAKLDGCGHTITLTTANIPLFNKINGATVSNLTLATASPVTSPVCYNNWFGVLGCQAVGTGCEVSNCTNTADITFNVGDLSNRYVGGLVGNASGCSFISNHNTGTIISDATYIGGIAGNATNTPVNANNTNSGDIIFRTETSISHEIYIGGVAGYQTGSINVTDCRNEGTILIDGITSTKVNCGGLVGESTSNFANCSNYGTIRCNNNNNNEKNVGGILGVCESTERNMLNCINEGDIQAVEGVLKMYSGGLIGKNRYMHVKNSYAFCNVSGNYASGIVGDGRSSLMNQTSIENCYFFGTLTSSNNYGLTGGPTSSFNNYFTITHCFYKAGYNMRSGTNASDSGNGTIKADDPLTLSDESALAAALNSGAASITGARSWTTSGGHVVLVQE